MQLGTGNADFYGGRMGFLVGMEVRIYCLEKLDMYLLVFTLW
jgi:hypothetical protein